MVGSCSLAPTGRVELYFLLDAEQTGGLANVTVAPEWGGVNRGPLRDADWHRVPAVMDRLTLLPGVPVLAAAGNVVGGDYMRAFVAASEVTALPPVGDRTRVESHIEPTVTHVPIRRHETTIVDITLVLRPLPSWREPGWAAFVKSAAVR